MLTPLVSVTFNEGFEELVVDTIEEREDEDNPLPQLGLRLKFELELDAGMVLLPG